MSRNQSLKYTFKYQGPITHFGKVVASNFTAITQASSHKQALNNISFRAKQALGLTQNSRIELNPNNLRVL